MKVEVQLERPEQILERIYPNGKLGGFVVDGTPPAPLGTRVELVLRVGSTPPAHFELKTQLAWARRKASLRLGASFGLEFLAEEARGRARLLAFARGQELAAPLRSAERVHVELPALLVHAGRQRKEQLADLSWGGAFLRTHLPLPPGTAVALHVRPPRSLRKLHLQAEWDSPSCSKTQGRQRGCGAWSKSWHPEHLR